MSAPGEQDRYTFTLAAPSRLYFDSLTNNANLRWSLSGPAGTPVSNRTFTTSDASGISGNPVLSLPAGAYTLTVSGSAATTGAYSFRLLDLSQATALTPGTPVSSTFSPANATTAYRFTAVAGNSYYFAHLSGSQQRLLATHRPLRSAPLRHRTQCRRRPAHARGNRHLHRPGGGQRRRHHRGLLLLQRRAGDRPHSAPHPGRHHQQPAWRRR